MSRLSFLSLSKARYENTLVIFQTKPLNSDIWHKVSSSVSPQSCSPVCLVCHFIIINIRIMLSFYRNWLLKSTHFPCVVKNTKAHSRLFAPCRSWFCQKSYFSLIFTNAVKKSDYVIKLEWSTVASDLRGLVQLIFTLQSISLVMSLDPSWHCLVHYHSQYAALLICCPGPPCHSLGVSHSLTLMMVSAVCSQPELWLWLGGFSLMNEWQVIRQK